MKDHHHHHSPSDSNPSDSNELTLTQLLEHYVLPRFTLARRYAESQQLHASMDFEREDPRLTRLRLSVRRPGEDVASSYQVIADEYNQRVIHEQYFAADQSTLREETLPAALNVMVLDSRLEAFFSRALDMLLPYLKQSHPPGF